MKVIVCGSRGIKDYDLVKRVIEDGLRVQEIEVDADWFEFDSGAILFYVSRPDLKRDLCVCAFADDMWDRVEEIKND